MQADSTGRTSRVEAESAGAGMEADSTGATSQMETDTTGAAMEPENPQSVPNGVNGLNARAAAGEVGSSGTAHTVIRQSVKSAVECHALMHLSCVRF